MAVSLGSVVLSIEHTLSSLDMGLWLFRDNSAAWLISGGNLNTKRITLMLDI